MAEAVALRKISAIASFLVFEGAAIFIAKKENM